MKNKYDTIVILALIAMLFLVLTLAGCFIPPKTPGLGGIPSGPGEALANAVANTNWLITVCIVGMAISLAALINGSKSAIGSLIGCSAALVLDLMVIRYATVLAFLGLAGGVAALVWIVFIKNRALKEIVQTVEEIKPSVKQYSFFDGSGQANSIQMPTTQKIVKAIREKLHAAISDKE